MKLKKATVWVKQWFDDSTMPAPDTVKKWIAEDSVPGFIIGGTAYIDEDRWLDQISKKVPIRTEERMMTGTDLLR